jgi:DinB superfamily
MSDAAEQLRTALVEARPKLNALSEAEAVRQGGTGKWVKKEILGHLIDSALNNHQRFVRAQLADRLVWPGYEQDAWVSVQSYRQRPWSELVELWDQLNRHLVHLVATVPPIRLATPCVIGGNEPVTLEWLMSDYVRHLRHHLSQIFAV